MDDKLCCPNCFNEPALASFVEEESDGRRGDCSYCGSENVPVVDPSDLSETFTEVIGRLCTNYSNNRFNRMMSYEDGEDLFLLLQNEWEPINDIACAEELLQDILAVDEYRLAKDGESGPEYFTSSWWTNDDLYNETPLVEDCLRQLENTVLKHGSRILPFHMASKPSYSPWEPALDHKSAEKILRELFEIHRSTLPKAKALWRARIGRYDTVKELGAPPPERCAVGRLNTIGQPVFYGALDREVAIAEVRPSTGDTVSIARFKATSELVVVDFTTVLSYVSPFAFLDGYLEWNEHHATMHQLSGMFGKPVRKNDAQREYLFTQYLADRAASFGYDGVVYGSSMVSEGLNLVVFDPSRVALQGKPEFVAIKGVSYETEACTH